MNSLERALAQLRKTNDGATALAVISDAEISTVAERVGERSGLTRFEPTLELVVDREKARYGTWYEMFVRSQGIEPGKPAPFTMPSAGCPSFATSASMSFTFRRFIRSVTPIARVPAIR